MHPAASFLLGILVDAGDHEVRVVYREPGLAVGAVIALAALLLLPTLLRRAVRAGT